MRLNITGLLLFLALGLFGQTVRTVGVVYTASAPVHTPSGQGAWIAVDTTSGSWYEWERTTGLWRDAGYRIQLTNTTGAPSYTPSKARGRVALNSGDSLYAYQAGVWDCLNCVTASDTASYLEQDSILVYYVNGIEFDRDTIPFVTLTKILQIVSDSIASLPDSIVPGYGVAGYIPQYFSATKFDTTQLYWDGVTRLGINYSSPQYALDVTGDGQTIMRLRNATSIGTYLRYEPNGYSHWLVGGEANDFIWYANATYRMRLTNAGFLSIGAGAPTSKLDITTNALGVTQTTASGLALVNTTAAAAGAQQMSPGIRWTGQGWKTNATAGSQSVDFIADLLPVQGTANPSGKWKLKSSVNGGAYTTVLEVDLAGNTIIGRDANSTITMVPGYNNVMTQNRITFYSGGNPCTIQGFNADPGIAIGYGQTLTNPNAGVPFSVKAKSATTGSPIQVWDNNAGTDIAAMREDGFLNFVHSPQGGIIFNGNSGKGVFYGSSNANISIYSNFTGHDFRVWNGSSYAQRGYLDNTGFLIGASGTSDRSLQVENATALTNTVDYPFRLSHVTSGTATTNFGIGQEYELENASGINRVAATEEVTYSDAVNATEDATWTLKLMRAGTLTEALRFISGGQGFFSGYSFGGQRWAFHNSAGTLTYGYIRSSVDGVFSLTNAVENDFNRLSLGPATVAFPSLKRASNNIEIKNADDTFGAGLSVGVALNSSAILEAFSTTKGFLPPRGTTAQMNAIASPAEGLMFYDLTVHKLYVYDGSVWQACF